MAWTDIPQYIIDDILGFQNMNQVVDNFDFLKAGGVGTVYLTNLAVTTGKIANLDVTTGKIAALAVTTAKIAAANVTGAKLAADAKVSTGTYNGDGATSKAIAGVGFTSRVIVIIGEDGSLCFKTDSMAATQALRSIAGGTFIDTTNAIIAIGADGFTVDDDGLNLGPNSSGITYFYMCWI